MKLGKRACILSIRGDIDAACYSGNCRTDFGRRSLSTKGARGATYSRPAGRSVPPDNLWRSCRGNRDAESAQPEPASWQHWPDFGESFEEVAREDSSPAVLGGEQKYRPAR